MSRLALALAILIGTIAACGSAPTQPSPAQAAPPTPVPTAAGSPSAPAAALTPTPAASPAAVELTAGEQHLLAGVRRGAVECQPVREGLPGRAVAGIECASDDAAVAKVGFYLFEGQADMLDAYYARMDAEGVKRDTVACLDGEGESAYTGGDADVPSRQGCFVNDEGFANYRATVPGALLYIGVLGRSSNMRSLVDFAWLGNQDTPGQPTLWYEPAR